MTVPEIDSSRIFSAILASGVTNPVAIERGSELVDHWSQECAVADQKYRTLGLEVGWFIQMDPRTFIVGAIDKLAYEPRTYVLRDADDAIIDEPCVCGCLLSQHWIGIDGSDVRNCSNVLTCGCSRPSDKFAFWTPRIEPFVFERKTTASSKTWTVDRWLSDLSAGSQVATYALALQRGTFIDKQTSVLTGNVSVAEIEYSVASPRVLARAVTKSKPPQMWPDANGAWIELTPARLNAQWNAFRVEAAAIHARRQLAAVPWQTPGFQCSLTFGFTKRPCSAWATCHDTLEFPEGGVPLRGLSPGSESVVKHLVETGRISLDRAAEYVVLSASSFKSVQQCPELWRQESIGATKEADNEAMDTGTVVHKGLEEFDRIMKENGY